MALKPYDVRYVASDGDTVGTIVWVANESEAVKAVMASAGIEAAEVTSVKLRPDLVIVRKRVAS